MAVVGQENRSRPVISKYGAMICGHDHSHDHHHHGHDHHHHPYPHADHPLGPESVRLHLDAKLKQQGLQKPKYDQQIGGDKAGKNQDGES